ncbi:hypothetical protein HZH66_005428 [Vespula vulgaris]|uniref:Uncharacterized protein n=1 Tax=Vespula vulgaris TaxID=7454 RepID=A0A834KAJ8_VESVU|nr:hypothetical protein HZH66_005428 [Vespula vulgaris]
MGGAHGRGLLCWSSSFVLSFPRARMFRLPFLLFLFFFSSFFRISIYRRRSDVSLYGSLHNRLLGANTGRIERTLARVSAGTSVVFSGAIKSYGNGLRLIAKNE